MNQTLRSVGYCFKLSWSASALYTLVRLVGRLLFPAASILQAYIVKQVIDTIVRGGNGEDINSLHYLIAATAALTIFSTLMNQWVEYCSGRQREMLTKVMTPYIEGTKPYEECFEELEERLNFYLSE